MTDKEIVEKVLSNPQRYLSAPSKLARGFIELQQYHHGDMRVLIENIEFNCGTLYYEIDGQKYYVAIQKCEPEDEKPTS